MQKQKKTVTPKPRSQSPKRRLKKPGQTKAHPKKAKKLRKDYGSSSSEEEQTEDSCIETDGSLKKIDKTDEQEIHVEIDSLPPLITTESDGKVVEIEIIDEMKKIDDSVKGKHKKGTKGIKKSTKSDKKDTVESQKDAKEDTKETKEDKQEDKTENKEDKPKIEIKEMLSDDEIFKKPLRVSPRLKPVLKRDMKKVLLKSRFRKMGMLPLANFDEAGK